LILLSFLILREGPVAVAAGMWESRSDFQGVVGGEGNLFLVFLPVPTPVISAASSSHALFLCAKPANSFALACCMLLAAPVSL
jgi:hypothetical protein